MNILEMQLPGVLLITTAEYSTPNNRPVNSELNCVLPESKPLAPSSGRGVNLWLK